jgi:tripartite ATP-independent transporter DctP family solute receptor
MKKMSKVAILLLTVLFGFTFTLCGTGEAATKFSLSAVCAGLPESSPSGRALKLFAEKVAEYSGGSVEISTFFGSDLGSLTACVEGMASGTIDIVTTGTSYFSGYIPEIQVFELPYIFKSNDYARKTLDGEPGDKVRELFSPKGIILLCYWESGLRHVSNSRSPIITPADMKGLKIRTVVSKTQQKTWEAFGAIPMAIDMNETFTALQQGTVDAQENTLAQIVSTKMYEVQKYLSLSGHAYTPMPFGISRMTWEKLDDAQREAVTRAAEEARDYQRALDDESDRNDVQFLKDAGIIVEENPDREAFAALVQPVYDTFVEQVGNDTYLKIVQEYVSNF